MVGGARLEMRAPPTDRRRLGYNGKQHELLEPQDQALGSDTIAAGRGGLGRFGFFLNPK